MIVAIIPFEDIGMYNRIKSRSPFYEVKLLKGRIEIDLKESVTVDVTVFPRETEYYITAYECGGGATNTGLAEIICGEGGEKLKPIEIYTEGHLSNKTHAKFRERNLVCVTSTKRGSITMTESYFYKHYDILTIRTEEFWKGNIWDLPVSYSMFRLAVEAAHDKAGVYHCRKAMYILEEN